MNYVDCVIMCIQCICLAEYKLFYKHIYALSHTANES